MKRFFALVFVLSFCTFVLGDLKLLWDAPTQNTDGSVYDDHSHYLVAISQQGQDLRDPNGVAEVVTSVECADQVCDTMVSDMLAGMPAATYTAWVRAVDTSGNASAWSTPLNIVWDGGAAQPNAPANVRVEVIVNVTVRTQ
jgi:hypothetical protein